MLLVTDYFTAPSDYAKGFSLFQAVKAQLATGKEVEVDFTGAGGVSSSFLHGFLGEAFTNYGVEQSRRLLKIKNVTKGQADLLRNYLASYLRLRDQAA